MTGALAEPARPSPEAPPLTVIAVEPAVPGLVVTGSAAAAVVVPEPVAAIAAPDPVTATATSGAGAGAAEPDDAGRWFATGTPASTDSLRDATNGVLDALARWSPGEGPWVPATLDQLHRSLDTLDGGELCPEHGVALDTVLDQLATTVLPHSVRVTDPRCAAHLHCPTLIPAAAAELAIGVTNQSMDSFDQAPIATVVEDRVVGWFAALLGLPEGASGVFTSGGTASNLLGLTLARAAAARRAGHDVWHDGLPPDAGRWRIVCSEATHFSVARSAALLGLGTAAVVTVAVDDAGALDVAALDRALAGLDADGLEPIAIVATAGTTDLGALDPLDAIADRAAARRCWYHVDAAVGAALALSPTHRPRLRGIERADSVTADLHKLFWQPIGTSILTVRDERALDAVVMRSDYLDRAEDVELGALNLVGRSLDTSRRFDALKVWVSMRTLGRARMGAMVEHLLELAAVAAGHVDAHPDLALAAPAQTVTAVFRWCPPDVDDDTADRVNTAVQRRLFDQGRAVLGRTRHRGRVHLKLTFVNPTTTAADVRALLDLIVAEAGSLAAGEAANDPTVADREAGPNAPEPRAAQTAASTVAPAAATPATDDRASDQRAASLPI